MATVLVSGDRVSGETSADVRPGTPGVVGFLLGSGAAVVGVQLPGLGSASALTCALVLLGAGVAALSSIGTVRTLRLGAIDLVFLLYVLVLIATELINAIGLRHDVYLGTAYVATLAYVAFVSARMVCASIAHAFRFLRALALPGVGVAIVALMQMAGVPGINAFLLGFVHSEGLERRIDAGWSLRATSTIGHWTALGGYLSCILFALCAAILIGRMIGRRPAGLWMSLAVVFIGLLATLTLATIFLGAVLVVATFVLLKVPLRLLVTLAVTGTASWVFFGEELLARLDQQRQASPYVPPEFSWLPETIAYRIGVWSRETIPSIGERPFLGWGADVYASAPKGWPIRPEALVWLSPESQWFRTWLESGFLALVLLALLLVLALRVLRRVHLLSLPGAKPLGRLAVLWLLGLVAISCIHSHLSNPGVPLPMWACIGAMAGVLARERPQREARA